MLPGHEFDCTIPQRQSHGPAAARAARTVGKRRPPSLVLEELEGRTPAAPPPAHRGAVASSPRGCCVAGLIQRCPPNARLRRWHGLQGWARLVSQERKAAKLGRLVGTVEKWSARLQESNQSAAVRLAGLMQVPPLRPNPQPATAQGYLGNHVRRPAEVRLGEGNGSPSQR